MIKIQVKKTLEVPQEEFDSWCRSYYYGRKEGRILLREKLEKNLEKDFKHQLNKVKEFV